ncbi:MAG: flagellin [Rhodospirillales bacterium]
MGSNVALLQTRLRFTTDYVNTLEAGAGKLTLADINEEGANLLALQTRQQLGISALAFAGQAEQSILALFN